ncbi:hypothetical protein LA080_007135 [Diaporthe eres]|uniref:Ankyrin repeat protein n=1 Tax=Diaporthe vaccinii TaxID=105482 RepID=A0ABR4DZC9_9PEZI|nr:hypothetical protein LA080_007135 [Diaporthe eres]
MADPLTAIGSASAIVQLIGGVASGLRTLRNAVVAIKDAPKTVKRLEDKIWNLEQCLKFLEKYFQQRPSKIPYPGYETDLNELIQEVARSCTEPLTILKDKLPRNLSKKNVTKAFELWINDNAITQARDQIDEYIPNLNLLIQTLNLFKADQADELLHQIAATLNQPAKHRLPHQFAAVYEVNTHSLETTIKGIRNFANNAAALVAVQATSTTTTTSSRYAGPLGSGPTTAGSNPVQVPAFPGFPKSQRQLELEWEQNRKYLERLINYGLFESAEKIQQRGLEIKEELNTQHEVPFLQEERDEMEGRLADILIECKVEGSKEKAVSLLEKKLMGEYPEDGGTEQLNRPLPLPSSSMDPQRRLSFHYKLGRLYKETHQMHRAEPHLREAFNTYAVETPRDISKIREVGEELLELYDCRVQFGDMAHRPVLVSQRQAFEQELHEAMGRPLEHHKIACGKALEWCKEENIAVSTENDEPRFDILDDEGSSPLHHAAEKCEDVLALQQMMDNSDTLENPDSNEDTPLLVAVSCSNTAALAVLLQKGANVKARDRQQQTPLHRSQKPSVTKLLLHHRLRRASTMTSGLFDEARRFSSSSSSTFTTSPPNSIADQDIEIDAQDAHKRTPLYLACWQGKEKTISLLLQAGANPNIASHEHTPLTITIESKAQPYIRDPKRKVEIVATLVSRKADPEPGKKILKNPRGMQKEILKALEGHVQPKMLARNDSRRDSGYQPSLSSIASSKPQLDHLEFGPDWSSEFGKPED